MKTKTPHQRTTPVPTLQQKHRNNTGLSFVDGLQASVPSSSPFLRYLGKPGGIVHDHTVAFCGEVIGTFLFLFFAFAGTQVANSQSTTPQASIVGGGGGGGSDPAKLLYISMCFGFSLLVNVWVFFRISGGLFNPAVCMHAILACLCCCALA